MLNGGRKHDATGRSSGAHKRKKFSRINGAWVPYRVEMLQSPAWRILSLSARKLLNRLEIELAGHAGHDNGRLPCTYEDFVTYGIDRHAIAPAIREAVALGFITYEQGCGGNSEFKHPNKFHLTYRNTDDAPPTDDWKSIQNVEEARALAASARKAPSNRRSKN